MLSRESRYLMIHTPPSIDAEFASLIPPLTPEEYKALSLSIQEEGCRDPLVIWESDADGPVLLDGHNRLRICEQLGVHYRLLAVPDIQNRMQAKLWMLRNQLARRNLTPEQASQLRGQRYNLEKHASVHRPTKSYVEGQNDPQHNNEAPDTTAERLAEQYKVSPATIKRDGYFAAAVDTLAENVGPEVRQDILAGDSPLGKGDIIALAKAEPEQQREVLAQPTKEATKAAAAQVLETPKRRKEREQNLHAEERDKIAYLVDEAYRLVAITPERAVESTMAFRAKGNIERVQLIKQHVDETVMWLQQYSLLLGKELGSNTIGRVS